MSAKRKAPPKSKGAKKSAHNGLPQHSARFIEPMECLAVKELPSGPTWVHELKLDGYRMQPAKHAGDVVLYSRRGNVLNPKFSLIASDLKKLPDGTVIDGEVVALDEGNRSDFSLLQNFRSASTRIRFYGFDILAWKGRLLTSLSLSKRREILAQVLPASDRVSIVVVNPRPPTHILEFAKTHGLEGVVSKNTDSLYAPGRRSGMWCKHRLNQRSRVIHTESTDFKKRA
jgi:ATP-dependent DNA ligase